MGRKVDADDIVGTQEIADRLAVARSAVIHDWLRRYPDFPKPIAFVGRQRLWNWPDIAAWARRTERL
ncbi:MAG TPA: hypothetical protein VM938_06065 [Acidimicrobiales bacterium]|nr:hypothetical protein [Acidimicrobiales bacterium]